MTEVNHRHFTNPSAASTISTENARAALNFHFSSSSAKHKNANFEWESSKTVRASSASAALTKKESPMDFALLSSWDLEECSCRHDCGGHDRPPPARDGTMPPPIPARKASLMDFDDISSSSSETLLPPTRFDRHGSSQDTPFSNHFAPPLMPLRKDSRPSMTMNVMIPGVTHRFLKEESVAATSEGALDSISSNTPLPMPSTSCHAA